MNTPRCPYCRARAAAGTYGDAAAALPVHFCPRVPGPSSCPYAGAPIAWAPPATDAQRAQAQEFETRLAAARRVGAPRAIEDMSRDHVLGWTALAGLCFILGALSGGMLLQEIVGHWLPFWAYALLLLPPVLLLTYLRERHHAARHWKWYTHLTPPIIRPDKTASPQTTTTDATSTADSRHTPTNTGLTAPPPTAS